MAMIRRPSGVLRRPPFSKIFHLPIKAKFYRKHLWEGGTNVFINSPGHMIKMPINFKNPLKFFSGTTGWISTKEMDTRGTSAPTTPQHTVFILISAHAPISAHPGRFRKTHAYAHTARIVYRYFTQILHTNTALVTLNFHR